MVAGRSVVFYSLLKVQVLFVSFYLLSVCYTFCLLPVAEHGTLLKICNSATSLLPEADDSRSWTSASQLLAEQLFSDSCSIWTTKKLKLAYRYLIPELVFLTTGNSVADPDKLKKTVIQIIIF